MQILDGRKLAAKIRQEVKAEIKRLGLNPGLAVILVGDNPASHLYVGLKEKAAREVEIKFEKYVFPNQLEHTPSNSPSQRGGNDTLSPPFEGGACLHRQARGGLLCGCQQCVIAQIQQFNAREDIHGILVQVPLPKNYDEDVVIAQIDPKKDVDGFHQSNLRAILTGAPKIFPAVALAIVQLVDYANELRSANDKDKDCANAVAANRANNYVVEKELSYKLNGLLFEVQNQLGTKFQEKHYGRALELLFQKHSISYKKEVAFDLQFEGNKIGSLQADFVVEDKILLELKATDRITGEHKLQLLRYIEALGLPLAIIVNFRQRPLQVLRVVNTKNIRAISGATFAESSAQHSHNSRAGGHSRHPLGKAIIIVNRTEFAAPLEYLLKARGAEVKIILRAKEVTSEIADQLRTADVLITARGRAGIIKGEMLKNGAIVIDAGTNKLPDGRTVGDVDYNSTKAMDGFITPVPGGVGPMTVAMLLRNALELAKRLTPSNSPSKRGRE